MALDPATAPSLTKFSLLSFDVYGTLIDETTGIVLALSPLLNRLPPTHPANDPTTSHSYIQSIFDKTSSSLTAASPTAPYTTLTASIYLSFAEQWGLPAPPPSEATTFAEAMGSYPPFPDTVAALQALGKRYRLVALTNTTKAMFSKTLSGPLGSVHFDAGYTAEDIGSYKPDHRNFRYLYDHVKESFGIEQKDCLHVAQGVKVDHVPAKELGVASAWISRNRPEGETGYDGVGEEAEGKVAFQWRWSTLGDMARDVEKAFAEEGKAAA